jgi:hypothetical protein
METNQGSVELRRSEREYIKQSSPGALDRQQDLPTTPRGESEYSERGGSPYPTSPGLSDYCQSASGEGYATSSRSYDMDGDGAVHSPHDEIPVGLDEDFEEDLSSEPPPQRSDGVSQICFLSCHLNSRILLIVANRNGIELEKRYMRWRLALQACHSTRLSTSLVKVRQQKYQRKFVSLYLYVSKAHSPPYTKQSTRITIYTTIISGRESFQDHHLKIV